MRQANRKSLDTPAETTRPTGELTVRPSHGKLGVLVVDNDHLVRVMVQLGLERNGFEVWTAPSDREALKLYREHREHIAVVLLDVRMPGLGGPATLDALRELNRDVPACFMSGDTAELKPDELRKFRSEYLLAKPFQLDELANILRLLAHGVPLALLPGGRTCHG
jgi:CheY-like chemotaxis protein